MNPGDTIQNIERPELRAKVNWACGEEFGAAYIAPEQYVGAMCVNKISEWMVILEAPLPVPKEPDLKSRAQSMSINELRASIENLRTMRSRAPVKTKTKKSSAKVASGPLAEALAKLTPEQLAKIKGKLGI